MSSHPRIWQKGALQSIVLVSFLFLLFGCGIGDHEKQALTKIQTNPPTQSPQTILPSPLPKVSATQSILPDSGWISLHQGIERRVINQTNERGELHESFYILRINPQFYYMDVDYQPDEPKGLNQWLETTGALIVVNGGFFTSTYEATGLIITNGQPKGVSYKDFGGMLAITKSGPELRWLPQQPYSPQEPLQAGLQSFPMLIVPEGQPNFPVEDGLRDRRTLIGLDENGLIVILIGATGRLTLRELGQFLLDSDLNLKTALNLDGGSSSGLILAQPKEGIAAFSLLPSVIAVYPK